MTSMTSFCPQSTPQYDSCLPAVPPCRTCDDPPAPCDYQSAVAQPWRPDAKCSTAYKSSSEALLRSREQRIRSDDDPQYIEGCRRLVEYFFAMWRNQKMCDVVLKTDNDYIQAHKLTLAAYSTYLEDKFLQFPASDVVTIDLSDFNMETVVSVLNFIYTTELNIDKQTVGPLLKCADELGITVIVKMCLNYLENITVNNAILYYSIADNYALLPQKEIIYKFIVCNFMEIARTPHFSLMPVERVISFLQDDNLNVSCELDVFFLAVCWVDCERAERLKLAPRLLTEAVRMQLISPENLVADVEPVEWLFDNQQCQAIYIQALKFHALNLSNSRLVSKIGPQQRPRGAKSPYSSTLYDGECFRLPRDCANNVDS